MVEEICTCLCRGRTESSPKVLEGHRGQLGQEQGVGAVVAGGEGLGGSGNPNGTRILFI